MASFRPWVDSVSDEGDRAAYAHDTHVAVQAFRAKMAVSGQGSEHCSICGSEISTARRAALPSARTCKSCETAREKAEKKGRL